MDPPDFLNSPPSLVIEVAARSTLPVDSTTKSSEYASFGVDLYWIVIPEVDRPSLMAFELRGTEYEQVALVAGDEVFEAVRPFQVRIVPSLLVADGNDWRSLIR